MRNFELKVVKRGIESCLVEVSAVTHHGNTVTKQIDLSGNATSAALWGAQTALSALNELVEENR